MRPDDDKFLVICVDGGGIRGLVPAMLLQHLYEERELEFEDVDLFAGTSTGSLIAAGLAADISIGKIVATYRSAECCRQIFEPFDDLDRGVPCRRGIAGFLVAALARFVRGQRTGLRGVLDQLLLPRYSTSGFATLLQRLAPHPTTIGELKRRVFLPSLCLDTTEDGHPSWRPTAFHNLPSAGEGPVGFGGHPGTTLVDAVLASSSAPVAFAPYEIDGRLFVDGCMVAINPSALALTAAIGSGLIGGEEGVSLRQVYVLSLGTGANNTRYPPEGVTFPTPFGVLGWMWPSARGRHGRAPAFPLMSALEDAVRDAADYQVRAMLPEDNYRRVELPLGDDHIALDDCGAIPDLAERLSCFVRRDDHWKEVRGWVGRHFGRR